MFLFFLVFLGVLEKHSMKDSLTLGLQTPFKKVLWGVFRGLNTFLEGVWSPRVSVGRWIGRSSQSRRCLVVPVMAGVLASPDRAKRPLLVTQGLSLSIG